MAQFRLTIPVRAGDRLLSSPLPLMPSSDPAIPAQATAKADKSGKPDKQIAGVA